MAHVRKQIRDAAATALAGLSLTGSNVFPSRTHELQDAELPALRVYTNDEAVEKMHGDGDDDGEEERTIELVVECCSKKSSGLDDEIDTIIEDVEEALAGNQSIGGAQYVQLIRIEIDMEGEAEKEVGVARMTFQAMYFVALGAPDTAL